MRCTRYPTLGSLSVFHWKPMPTPIHHPWHLGNFCNLGIFFEFEEFKEFLEFQESREFQIGDCLIFRRIRVNFLRIPFHVVWHLLACPMNFTRVRMDFMDFQCISVNVQLSSFRSSIHFLKIFTRL